MTLWPKDVTVRPLPPVWPNGERTDSYAQKRAPFSATWSSTLGLLDHELFMLAAERRVLCIDVPENKIRVDGFPRADATISDPAVVISFSTVDGPLEFACDRFTRWQDNVRAIALGLEALRRVDRYGISSRAEQYQGWRQIEPGAAVLDTAAALSRLVHWSGLSASTDARTLYKAARRRAHPDAGGNHDAYMAVTEAGRALGVVA